MSLSSPSLSFAWHAHAITITSCQFPTVTDAIYYFLYCISPRDSIGDWDTAHSDAVIHILQYWVADITVIIAITVAAMLIDVDS